MDMQLVDQKILVTVKPILIIQVSNLYLRGKQLIGCLEMWDPLKQYQ